MDIILRGPDRDMFEEGEVMARMGMTASGLKRLIETNRFPPPFVINGRRMWSHMDLVSWAHLTARMGEPPNLEPEIFPEKEEISGSARG